MYIQPIDVLEQAVFDGAFDAGGLYVAQGVAWVDLLLLGVALLAEGAIALDLVGLKFDGVERTLVAFGELWATSSAGWENLSLEAFLAGAVSESNTPFKGVGFDTDDKRCYSYQSKG